MDKIKTVCIFKRTFNVWAQRIYYLKNRIRQHKVKLMFFSFNPQKYLLIFTKWGMYLAHVIMKTTK